MTIIPDFDFLTRSWDFEQLTKELQAARRALEVFFHTKQDIRVSKDEVERIWRLAEYKQSFIEFLETKLKVLSTTPLC